MNGQYQGHDHVNILCTRQKVKNKNDAQEKIKVTWTQEEVEPRSEWFERNSDVKHLKVTLTQKKDILRGR